MAAGWDEEEERLEIRARQMTKCLAVEAALSRLGQVHLVGSAALHVMVARDIDLVVVVSQLDVETLRVIARLAAQLMVRREVHAVTVRDETGRWNTDPDYPDGVYLFIECADEAGEVWTLDVWFVDEPERKPALQHVGRIGPCIDPASQAAILAIKRATGGRRPDGTRLPSIEIYEAVVDDGIRTPEEFAQRAR
ncbi:MAG TPA: hypothetical protein VIP98_25805 [Microlunatus sp.]